MESVVPIAEVVLFKTTRISAPSEARRDAYTESSPGLLLLAEMLVLPNSAPLPS